MDWEVSSAHVVALLLATVRTSAWLIICPPFNGRLLPGTVKGLLAFALAMPMVPKLAASAPSLDAASLLVSAVEQAVIGLALGFVTSLFFAAIQAAGDLIDFFGGFSVAQAFDPFSGQQSSVFGRFYRLIAVTLLFVTDAYQLVIRGFLNSFDTLPLDGAFSLANLNKLLTHGLGEMFMSALQIAGPLIAVLFVTDVALGLLNRVAPSLNAFALGFPAKIFLTLGLGGTAIMVLPRVVDGLVDQAVEATVWLAGG
jgi:flagellar biosynthetic protein FliR